MTEGVALTEACHQGSLVYKVPVSDTLDVLVANTHISEVVT